MVYSAPMSKPPPVKVKRPVLLTEERQQIFLQSLASGDTISMAAHKAGVTRRVAYNLRQRDDAFAEAWNQAYEDGADVLEQEALRRAVHGTLKPVYQQGQQVGEIREYSDNLLILLLKGRKPERYRDRVDFTSAGKSVQALGDALLAAAEGLEQEVAQSEPNKAH